MYKPIGSRTLAEAKEPQIRLGIQGYPKTGKTYAAMTFPNPVVVNLDRGLGAHNGRSDVIELPFYEESFCKTINPNHKEAEHTLRDTLLLFVTKEAPKLTEEQTLVWDGGTGTQNCYHKWYSCHKVFSKTSGKEDERAEWALKIPFFSDLFEAFKKLKCNVIYISHEQDKKDKDGAYSGKIRPLLSGQAGDQCVSHFTDWVRQLTMSKPDVNKLDDKTLSKWGMTKIEFQAMCDSFERNTIYYWQLEPDDLYDGGCSSLVNFPMFIPANYDSFKKYIRKYVTK